MCEEEREKPDWLSDLQNNQKHKERENIENSFDLANPALAYASPRYGRRSVPGTKSVENSPTKSSSNETKSNSGRSNSARPIRIRDGVKIKKTENGLAKSLEILRDDFEKLSIHGSTQEDPRSGGKTTETTQERRPSENVFREKQINEVLKGDERRSEEAVKVHKIGSRSKPPEGVKPRPNFWKADGEKTRKEFIIPELPRGQHLVINIKTTWGDKHFLGLNGIEIFNSKGIKPQIRSIMAKSGKNAINKSIENLIDNVYLTQDDKHMWMAPYTPNSNHLIHIEFDRIEELAVLRIWNYNKSRIHCSRGAKDAEIKLDNKFIFIGEIAMASGEILNTINSFGDTILFTTDEGILELVAENDEYFNGGTFCSLEDSLSIEEMRPLTGSNGNPTTRPEESQFKHLKNASDEVMPVNLRADVGEKNNEIIWKKELENDTKNRSQQMVIVDEIPTLFDDTQTVVEKESRTPDSITGKAEFFDETGTLYVPSGSALASDSAYETLSMPTGFTFTLQIHSTWGDSYYVGLNGVQIFDENGAEIKLHPQNVRADPEGVNILEGMRNDVRTPDKLIDGVYETTDGRHMWLAPVLPLTINRVEFVFEKPITLSSMKLWNYSKTPGRGVREFGILVDGLLIYNGELSQAPVVGSDGLPKIPCKTINFSDSDGRKNMEDFVKPQRAETSVGHLPLVDQSKRPLTTMTSQS